MTASPHCSDVRGRIVSVNVTGLGDTGRGKTMAFRQVLMTTASATVFAVATPVWSENHVDANTVVATVNGQEITLGHMIVLKTRLPAQYQNIPHDTLFEGILDQLVQQTLLAQSVDSISKGSQLTLENEERALWAQEEVLRLAEEVVTEDAIQSAYDEAFVDFVPETEYDASHILVDTEEEAQALVETLAGGADFAELAMEKSTGPSGPNGGQLGWFGLGRMVPPFEAAVVEMDVGAVSDPVQTQFGWHVIKLNGVRDTAPPALEEVRGDLEDQVNRVALEARIEELTQGAEVNRVTAADIPAELLGDISLVEN